MIGIFGLSEFRIGVSMYLDGEDQVEQFERGYPELAFGCAK